MSRTLNILLVLLQAMMLSQLPAIAGPTPTAAATDARLTEAHGDVYKRAFTDWTKEALGDPSPASVGDVVHEGMQIGTGKDSWAQLQWRHMSARAWANSVYAVSPNQRLVYLIGGEMLYQLDKNRGEHSPYYVWTNLLQARIRGTTVLFQATKTMSKITVLEGTVEVLNKVDHSVVTITPGTVYEIKAKGTGSQSDSEADTLTPISINSTPSTPIFETSKTVASVSAVDTMAVMNHGLLRNFETPLASLPLITDALSSVQSKLENAGKNVLGAVTQILHDSLTISSVPRALNYLVGENIRVVAQIVPGTFDFFAPEGIVGRPKIATPDGVPGADLPPNLIDQSTLQRVTSSSVLQPGAASLSALTAVTSGIGVTSGATAAGVTALTATQTASAGRLLTGVGGTLNTTLGTVGGTVGSLTGTVGGTVGSLTGTVGGVVGGVTGTVGGVVGGVTGTLGGLLGH